MDIDLSKFKAAEYCRKSSDNEDRQVQSIPDQRRELAPLILERKLNILPSARFGEAQSAKRPGRPEFNKMVAMIEQGEIEVIVCWKVNRLARNPIDGGKIQWLLQQGIIKAIVTPHKTYLPTDNVIMMAVELGMATQYSLDLSIDVARGMQGRVDKGVRPMRAPIGYLNDPAGAKGEKLIFSDPQRFDLVKRMWQFMLTGNYTVRQIVDIANEQWGLRTKATKKYPSHKLTIGQAYKMFNNTFYYGEFSYKGKEDCKGIHEAMITKEEFDLVQNILGRKGKPRAKHKRLPFTGLIICGSCGSMVVADDKHKFVKRENRVVHWIYHRCCKSKKKVCYAKEVKYEDLKTQVESYLDKITIPPEFLHWAIDVLRDNNALEESSRSQMLANQRKNYDDCLHRIQNLINLYVSPENAKRELLSDEEFKEQKKLLTIEKDKAAAEMAKIDQNVDGWLELTEQTFNFATYAKTWFEQGDYETKTHILRALGTRFALTDGILKIDLQKPFLVLKNGLKAQPLKTPEGEMVLAATLASDKTKNPLSGALIDFWSG